MFIQGTLVMLAVPNSPRNKDDLPQSLKLEDFHSYRFKKNREHKEMKAGRLSVVVPVVLFMSLLFTNVSLAQTHEVRVSRNFQPDPLIINGKSVGTHPTKCGNINTASSQVIEVTDSLPYLRLTVESGGKPTILIDGPGGRFCVLPDQYSQDKPEISGYWQAGKYSVYVGNLSEGQYTYTISISQQKK